MRREALLLVMIVTEASTTGRALLTVVDLFIWRGEDHPTVTLQLEYDLPTSDLSCNYRNGGWS